MTITQAIVNEIVVNAKASVYGLGPPSPGKNYNFALYHPPDLNNLALMLVSAHHDKYDIVSIMAAALQKVASMTEVKG